MSDGKTLTWTRWAVRIACVSVETTYGAVYYGVPSGGRFSVKALGYSEDEVRAVVEYTARGANGDDIKRRFIVAGIDRSRISVEKVASVDLEFGPNADLYRVVVPSPFAVNPNETGDNLTYGVDQQDLHRPDDAA